MFIFKTTTLILGLCSLVLLYSTLRLTLKEPFIIERGCETRILKTSSTDPNKKSKVIESTTNGLARNKTTQEEVRIFVHKALEQRFNTKINDFSFLSQKEKKIRILEQKGLAQKNIIQNILIREINFNGEKIIVHADRIFAVKQVRSNFPIKMLVDVRSKKRTRNNPYGLVLNQWSPSKRRKKRKVNESLCP